MKPSSRKGRRKIEWSWLHTRRAFGWAAFGYFALTAFEAWLSEFKRLETLTVRRLALAYCIGYGAFSHLMRLSK
jgi:hypothetical protein